MFIRENPTRDKSVPGPGAYSASRKAIDKQPGAFTLKPRTDFGSSKLEI